MAIQSLRTSVRHFLGVFSMLLASTVSGQTLINLGSQGRNVDFTNFPFTRPLKTGSSLPSTCTVSDVFLNTAAAAGQNLFVCTSTNTWSQQGGLPDPGNSGLVKRTGPNTTTVVAAPSTAIVGVDDTQTLRNKNIDASQLTSGTVPASRMPALTGDISMPAGSTATTLPNVNLSPGLYGDATHTLQMNVDAKGRVTGVSALNISQPTVNSSPGTFGSSTQIPVLTVNALGQVTAVTTTAATGGSGASANAGTMSAMPSVCASGSLYLATDQPVAQQLYICSSANTWTAAMSVGPSGALAINGGSLDIVTSVVPRLTAANNFNGVNTFNSGLKLNSGVSQATCDASTRGSLWFQNNSSSKDALQICAYSGSAFTWVTLY